MGDEEKKRSDDGSEESGWRYKSADESAVEPSHHVDTSPESAEPKQASVEWTASEFVAHEKGFGWYLMLISASLIIAAVIYFVTRDVFSVTVVLIMAAIFGVAGNHKPRVITYKADSSGLTIGNKFYPYSAHKSFSMPQEGPFLTVVMAPMKHFALPVGAYLSPDSQDKVLEVISGHLPMERGEPGTVDHLMRYLRF